ncbi:sortase B protein-sorting domain-containing protein [Neobacillus novalis]
MGGTSDSAPLFLYSTLS